MFEQASRLKLRFDYRGLCNVEDLWDLSVEQLDSIYRKLNYELKDIKEESLLEKKSQKDKILELKVDLIKHIVKIKLDEEKAQEERILKSERKQKLFNIIAEKQDDNLKNLSIEELNKLADDLEN